MRRMLLGVAVAAAIAAPAAAPASARADAGVLCTATMPVTECVRDAAVWAFETITEFNLCWELFGQPMCCIGCGERND